MNCSLDSVEQGSGDDVSIYLHFVAFAFYFGVPKSQKES